VPVYFAPHRIFVTPIVKELPPTPPPKTQRELVLASLLARP
jgi:hypothetical protein